MKITIGEKDTIVEGSLGNRMVKLVLKLRGRKGYNKAHQYKFESVQANINLFLELYPECEVFDEREAQKASRMNQLQGMINFTRPKRPEFVGTGDLYAHQVRALEKGGPMKLFALFMGTGTGKTKVALNKSVKHFCDGDIDAVVVITLKGVHTQWVDEQIPAHVHESIPYVAHAWAGFKTVMEKRKFEFFIKQPKLQFLSMNFDSFRGDKAYNLLRRFLTRHSGRVIIILDESQEIATFDSERSRTLQEFGKFVDYKIIMSGTPIPKNLVNEWSQFLFLSEDIVGQRYVTAFRAEYCTMGGFQDSQVVGHKNLERFNSLVAPYIFRVTKETELDLPPKNYTRETFEMHEEQLKHYTNLRKNFLSKLATGEVATVANAAVLVTRLQQISNGYLVDEDGTYHELPNPRLELLKKIDSRIEGKKIVWAHFNRDVGMIGQHFGKRHVQYVGSTSTKDRDYAKAAFMDPDSGIDIFLSNPAAGGTGLNLQGECATAIYYNNSFNAVHRWQSEDRIHRIGTYKTITYIDLVAKSSVDIKVLQNLKKKRDFQTLVLDDIRIMMEEETEEEIIARAKEWLELERNPPEDTWASKDEEPDWRAALEPAPKQVDARDDIFDPRNW